MTQRARVFMPGYEQGWLCFESQVQRRRLAPIPTEWESCAAQALEAYCRRAKPAGSIPRTP